MDIGKLRECIDLARTLNFTRSAEDLYISQPVLSKHIASVERELGFTVFERTKRSVELTKLGAVFIDGAIPVVEAFDNMMFAIENSKGSSSRSLKVGYLRGAAGRQIPYIQSGFANFYPEVEVEYITYEFAEVAEALKFDEVDIAIAKLPRSLQSEEYDFKPLFEDRYFVACDARHPLSELEKIRPEDLRGMTVALPASGFYTDDSEAIASFLDPETNGIELKHAVRDVNSLPILAQSQDWIGITFGHLRELYKDDLALIPLEAFELTATFGVLWKKRRESKVLRKWVEAAETVFGKAAKTHSK